MGNNPSSHPHHHPSRSNPTGSAPPTPTGHHHQQQQHQHLNQIHSSSPLNPLNSDHSSTNLNLPPLPPPTTTFVDGGYLFPLSNIYPSSPQDWLHPIVQHLILSRRLAPFYRGLEDWEPDWDRQTISHALQSISFSRINSIKQIQKLERQDSSHDHQPASIISFNHKSNSITKRFQKNLSLDQSSSSSPFSSSSSPSNNLHHQSSDQAAPFNPRHQIFEAVLNSQIRSNEIDQYLNQTVECPICFLYYPPNINLSRCCQQPICTECFTQIKRIDPTPQELKSEPACCPYCVESNFGVTYEPPPPHKRTDWNSAQAGADQNNSNTLSVPILATNSSSSSSSSSSASSASPQQQQQQQNQQASSDINSQSAPSQSTLMANLPTGDSSTDPTSVDSNAKAKRRQTTSHTSTDVVTTDSIQPDWQAKLEAIKAAVQRRANRRIIFRQEGDRLIPVGITSSRDPSGSAFLAAFEQDHSAISTRRGLSSFIGTSSGSHTGGNGGNNNSSAASNSLSGGTVRRHRGENPNYGVDLEELMIMEAMRLSLAEEEERKRKEAEEEDKLRKITEAISDACQGSGNPSAPSQGGQLDHQSSLTENYPESQQQQQSSGSSSTPTSRLNEMLAKPTPSPTRSPLPGQPPQLHPVERNDLRETYDHVITGSPQSIIPDLSSSHSEPRNSPENILSPEPANCTDEQARYSIGPTQSEHLNSQQ